jgi:hypothetical protein
MTVAYPIPRLPNPLTEEGLRTLMRERPFWDLKHPRSGLYRRAVERGFEMLYSGPARHDGIGRLIMPEPRPAHEVAGQAMAFNREMDRLERALEGLSLVARTNDGREGGFDERPRGRGMGDDTVHVQAHTRDGGKIEVVDYWRARPGQGAGAEFPKRCSLLGEADEAEDTQAGMDDSKPWEGRHNAELREAIAGYEQSADKKNDGYEERHKDSNALGRYQMTPAALKDIEWRNPNGTLTEEARRHGVAGDADFLKHPQAQETAMDKLLDRYEEQANAKRLFERVGQKIEGRVADIEVTEAGMMAAVHHGGADGTARYFKKIDQAGGVSRDAPLDRTETAIETRMRKSQGIDYQRKQGR